MRDMPKISIIIPTFNASKTLSDALESILGQSFTDYEVLIMDGLSSDNTVEQARSFQDARIRIVSEKDAGIYDAMNKGIQLAHGEWLYFLGCDDKLFDKETFQEIAPSLESDCDVVYGNVSFLISGRTYDGKFSRLKLLRSNICHQAIFTRKSVFQRIGVFNTEYKGLADWHFNMRWFNNKAIKFKYVPQIIAYYSEDGYSFSNPDLVFREQWPKIVQQNFPTVIRIIHRFDLYRIMRYVKRLLNHD